MQEWSEELLQAPARSETSSDLLSSVLTSDFSLLFNDINGHLPTVSTASQDFGSDLWLSTSSDWPLFESTHFLNGNNAGLLQDGGMAVDKPSFNIESIDSTPLILGETPQLNTPYNSADTSPISYSLMPDPILQNTAPQPHSTKQLSSSSSHSPATYHSDPSPQIPRSNTSPCSSTDSPRDKTCLKRQRNNAAAKRYRQKKIDRIEELEQELRCMAEERDRLRIELAKRDVEVDMLKGMVRG